MNRDDAFVMVPHRLSRDPRWAAVYADRETLGAWLQMFLTADACYPNPAPLPRLPDGVLELIVAAGFIQTLPGDRYVWAGLSEARSAKSDQAREAARARWGNAAGIAASNAAGMRRAMLPAHAQHAISNAESMPTKTKTEKVPSLVPPSVPARRVTGTNHEHDAGATLTAHQLQAWSAYGHEWDGFKAAWIGRGLRLPPTGRQDEPGTQRAILFEVLDARPRSLAQWVTEAHGKTSHDVVAHVLAKWHAIKADTTDGQGQVTDQGEQF
jgi:hypothetical protein